MTVRDYVWDATLELLAERPFYVKMWRVRERAGLDKSKDRTIRRTLNAMEASGWLKRSSENSKKWRHGPKYEDKFN